MTADVTSLETTLPPAARAHQPTGRTAAAGLIGNVLEWFDFAVYGYFASVIGQQFFPQSSPSAQQLLSFAVFALGFGKRDWIMNDPDYAILAPEPRFQQWLGRLK